MGEQSPTVGQDNHCIICYQRNVSWLCLSISLNLKKNGLTRVLMKASDQNISSPAKVQRHTITYQMFCFSPIPRKYGQLFTRSNLKSPNFSNFSTLLYKPFCGLLKLYM